MSTLEWYYAHMTVTCRQQVALSLYYVEGWSHRRIGQAIGSNPGTVYRLIERAKEVIVRQCSGETGNAHPIVERLCSLSPTSSTSHVGRAMTRQEELLDALALRLEQRDAELAMYEQWLDSDSHLPSHVKRNPYDQWELRYLQGKRGEPLPTTAYRADVAAAHCAADKGRCGLDCAGCGRQGGEG